VLDSHTPPPAARRPLRISPRGSGLRVVVVENHDDTRLLLCLLLEQLGHSVRAVATMREALRELAERDCDVLISDIGLPDGDGWELMRRLDPHHRPRIAIAMSGRGMSGDRARSQAAGYRHHLVKPTGPEQIADILAGAQRELRERQPQTA
jgi:two-component system CheB/CheR fusion protein